MFFRDRKDAGERLAGALHSLASADAVVLGLPRGGVIVGAELARILHLPLDVVMVRKLGHPDNPEYAIGAVSESGLVRLNSDETRNLGPVWLQKEIERQVAEAKRRRARYLGSTPSLDLEGRVAILVDDGVATGFTFRVALEELRHRAPRTLIAAIPIGPLATVGRLRSMADATVVLDAPGQFLGAIGAYYDSFCPVKDEEVIAALRSSPSN